jgi:hypothetical protein
MDDTYTMRTSEMALQFMATFDQEIFSPKHNKKITEALKILASKIQVSYPFLMINNNSGTTMLPVV